MNKRKLSTIKKQIDKIKKELQEIEEMRPGSLTRQYKSPKDKSGEFYQLSYTYQMKSKTEYVRPQFVHDIKQQISTYKKFKSLMEKWIAFSIEYSKVKMSIAKQNRSKIR